MSEALASGTAPALSVVVPVRNEAGNIAPLVEEIAAALDRHLTFEVIFVNDGSTDRTEAELTGLMASRPWLRQIKHRASCGQSAAVSSGVMHARAGIVVTLDGDGQNDPAFIPALVDAIGSGLRIGLGLPPGYFFGIALLRRIASVSSGVGAARRLRHHLRRRRRSAAPCRHVELRHVGPALDWHCRSIGCVVAHPPPSRSAGHGGETEC